MNLVYKIIVLLIALFAVSCNSPHKKNEPKNKFTVKKSMKALIKESVVVAFKDTVPKVVIPDGTIQVLKQDAPDSTSKVYLLQDCDANADDVKPFAPKLLWQGLYVSKNEAYIKNARLHFSREHGELDEEGEVTGWRIASDVKDYGYFISGARLVSGPVNRVNIPKNTLAPGEKQVFKYFDVTYTIYATGYYDVKNDDVTNYKLYLLAKVKGHTFNQLIMTTAKLGNEMHVESDEQIQIDFIGDIDGDHIPDLIIDRFGEFHGYTYLYLSKLAGKNAILNNVAFFGGSD